MVLYLLARKDFTNQMLVKNVSIKPGCHEVTLSAKATRVGLWSFSQVTW